MSICIFVVSHFDFEGWALVLIEQVCGHCLPFTFKTMKQNGFEGSRMVYIEDWLQKRIDIPLKQKVGWHLN